MTLRLVRDEPPKAPRRGRRPGKCSRPPILSTDEEKRFRAAMRGLHDAFGSWPCLASAMDTGTYTISHMMRGKTHVSGALIVKAMRASGLTFAELIGKPIAANRCRACGKVRAA